jgi:hypothetical protein
MTDKEIKTVYGEKFYVSIRRFIVIATDEGNSTCVYVMLRAFSRTRCTADMRRPILTHEHRGCTKKGVKPLKHGIVYDSHSKPKKVPGEPPMGFDPVQLEISWRGEKLAWQSRVNYSKLTTIEHNVKVYFIGRINYHDFLHIVGPAVDKCWSDKSKTSKRSVESARDTRDSREHRDHHGQGRRPGKQSAKSAPPRGSHK